MSLLAIVAVLPALWSIHAARLTARVDGTLIPDGHGALAAVMPHPDDEILTAAPFLDAYGRRATVIAVTDGDGFKPAVALSMRKAVTTPADFERFGRLRRGEQAQGLVLLTGRGRVPRLVRLGFSDRGLLPILTGDRVHRSPYTRNSRTEGSSGADGLWQDASGLFGALERTMAAAQPDVVLAPHPSDTHPDHRALGALAELALADLEASGRLQNHPVLYRYLVHSGPWPLPKGHHPGLALSPPRSLVASGTRWYAVPVSSSLRRRMVAALGAHRTQLTLLRPILLAFVRQNALVARIAPLHLPAGGHIAFETPLPSPAAMFPAVPSPLRRVAVRRPADGRRLVFSVQGPGDGRTLELHLWQPRAGALVARTIRGTGESVSCSCGGSGPILFALEMRSGAGIASMGAPRVLTLT